MRYFQNKNKQKQLKSIGTGNWPKLLDAVSPTSNDSGQSKQFKYLLSGLSATWELIL